MEHLEVVQNFVTKSAERVTVLALAAVTSAELLWAWCIDSVDSSRAAGLPAKVLSTAQCTQDDQVVGGTR